MSPSRSEREIWSRVLSLVLLGSICYGLPWQVFAALPVPAEGVAVLRIQGSNTVGAKLAPMLVSGFFEAQGLKDVAVSSTAVANEQRIDARDDQGHRLHATVAAHGTGTGFTALADGSTDLAAASRPIKASERQALAGLGDLSSAAAEQVIAIDGLAIVVHPDNPVGALGTDEVARLFAGDISNWSELGGMDAPVRIHARDDRSGTYDTFKELVLGAHGKALTPTARRYESNDELAAAVTRDRGAIGFVGLASIGKAKALGITDGDSQPMAPELTTVATEDYPLSRRLFFYAAPNDQSPWSRAFIDFVHSEAGQRIVGRSGYVAQRIDAVRSQPQADMPAFYRQLGEEAQRLTVNFRFDEGSAQLDNKALRDIERVAAYLHAQNKAIGSAALVGFGDPKSNPSRAALLSKLRAMTVRRELIKHGVYVREINGLGAELPVASNEGTSGRVKNRRVEIWVY